jgi:hypothetical protein
MRFETWLWGAALAAGGLACASGTDAVPGGAGGGGAQTGAGGSGGGLGGFGNQGGSAATPVIYAHTDTQLFGLEPGGEIELSAIGTFNCVAQQAGQDAAMTDLAVGADESLWGISHNYVWPLEGASCGAPIALDNPDGVRFYALTFAPAGVLHPTDEVLIAGNTAGELWSIDGAGVLTQRGNFGIVPSTDGNGHVYANPGKAWELSGDIVFVEGDDAPIGFATVRDCPNPPETTGCNSYNTLIEIDVPKIASASTGPVIKSVRGLIVKGEDCDDASTGDYGNMYGIAAWGSSVYGFSRSGNIVEIDTNDGSACLVQAFQDLKFAGAGLTTLAEVIPPPPK